MKKYIYVSPSLAAHLASRPVGESIEVNGDTCEVKQVTRQPDGTSELHLADGRMIEVRTDCSVRLLRPKKWRFMFLEGESVTPLTLAKVE